MDMPAECRKSVFLYTDFLPNFPPISISFLKEKHPILATLGALFKFAQNTPNLCNLGSFVSDENPPIAIPKFVIKHPKRQAHRPTYNMSMWEPLPREWLIHLVTPRQIKAPTLLYRLDKCRPLDLPLNFIFWPVVRPVATWGVFFFGFFGGCGTPKMWSF